MNHVGRTNAAHSPSRRLAALPIAAILLLLASTSLACTGRLGGAGADRGTTAAPAPRVTVAEVWYATSPAAGVWAELRIIMNNPLPARGLRTIVYLPPAVMEDFTLRSTEPGLLIPPARTGDGRYAFSFPAPIAMSPNWYRINLVFRGTRARPIRLGLQIDGLPGVAETRPVTARVIYADRRADPFKVVPEPLVAWLPATGRAAFPLVAVVAGLLGFTAVASTAVCIYLLRRDAP